MKLSLKTFAGLLQDRYFYLPALSAFMLALSRYPIKLHFLVFFAFIPLLYLLGKSKVSSPATTKIMKTAISFAAVYTLVALHWIGVVTAAGLIGAIFLYGFYFFLFFYLVFRITKQVPGIRTSLFVFAWLSFEWLQNYGELRFPWYNIGYALAEYTALIQVAEIGGVYLLSLLILIVNVLMFSAIRFFPTKKGLQSLMVSGLLFFLWTGYGVYRYKTLPLHESDAKAAIVQVSIPQYMKWTESFFDSTLALYEHYSLLAAQTEPDIIIWPEAAIPEYVLRSRRASAFVADVAKSTGTDIFLGLPHYEVDYTVDYRINYFNAATVFNKDGQHAQPYFKNILVPVGERIPFMDYIPILGRLDFGQANWEYGAEIAIYNLQAGEQTFSYSPIICFEIAFPAFTARIASQDVDFIINVTNDAWFKKTVGPYQHGMMTVIRAVETRKQFFRAANTGISMIVDPAGTITKKTRLFEKTFITGNIVTYDGKTIYVRYLRNYPIIFVIITFCLTIYALLSLLSLKKQ